MAKAGRPRTLDDINQREVCALVTAGYSLVGAARYVGCTAKTIRREAERNPTFGDQLRRIQLAAQLEPLRALRRKATTHWRAVAWLLERIDPEQFARYDSKLLKPEEVADLLENIRATLEIALADDPTRQVFASGIVDAARRQAGLPKGRRNVYTNLNELPGGFPDILASIRAIGTDPDAETLVDNVLATDAVDS